MKNTISVQKRAIKQISTLNKKSYMITLTTSINSLVLVFFIIIAVTWVIGTVGLYILDKLDEKKDKEKKL